MSAGETDKLVSMANQIASFFRAYPADEAARGIHDHIVAFWTPSMRRAFEARLDGDSAGVDALVLRAMEPGAARAADSPIKKEVASPATLGQLASDAG